MVLFLVVHGHQVVVVQVVAAVVVAHDLYVVWCLVGWWGGGVVNCVCECTTKKIKKRIK